MVHHWKGNFTLEKYKLGKQHYKNKLTEHSRSIIYFHETTLKLTDIAQRGVTSNLYWYRSTPKVNTPNWGNSSLDIPRPVCSESWTRVISRTGLYVMGRVCSGHQGGFKEQRDCLKAQVSKWLVTRWEELGWLVVRHCLHSPGICLKRGKKKLVKGIKLYISNPRKLRFAAGIISLLCYGCTESNAKLWTF